MTILTLKELNHRTYIFTHLNFFENNLHAHNLKQNVSQSNKCNAHFPLKFSCLKKTYKG